MPKTSVSERIERWHAGQKNPVEWHNGKWFLIKDGRPEELRDIKRYLSSIPMLQISNADDLQKLIDWYIIKYGDMNGWPPLPIIDDAKKRIEAGEVKPMAFPLNRKQLIIIRVMLEAKEERMFITTGVGGSGKSTFLNIIRQIYGNDVSACPLSDMSGYNLSEALKHRLIASDELSSDDLDSRALKTIISRQPIQINGKFERPIQITAQSALFYCCNNPPRVDVDDTGILRRIVYYEMNEKIKSPDFTKRSQVYTYDELVDIVAHAFMTDITDWFEEFKAETRKYITINNSVYICRKCATYAYYRDECRYRGLKAYSMPRWEKIKNQFDEWEEERILEAIKKDRSEGWETITDYIDSDILPF